MKPERTNRIEIDWKDLFKPINGLKTGPDEDPLINEIVIKPEIIPIIFVPGIMGSRLEYENGKRAWDPDSGLFMLRKYGRFFLDPEDRKLGLIGEQSHDPNFLRVCEHHDKYSQKKLDRGWGGIAKKFYGKILRELEKTGWPEPLRQCFDMPVYAFGYNWTASNADSGAKLATFIDDTIKENAERLPCRQVILVTHSMGGLVARAACKLSGAEGKVLGVVHGVQPATGSPAAYFRMKTGFETPRGPTGTPWDYFRNPVRMTGSMVTGAAATRVLGQKGRDVTIIMANSPGGLELLPNKLYKTNDGRKQWLRYTNPYGDHKFFPADNPYTEIYGINKVPYRLVNPLWLGENSGAISYDEEGYSQWSNYIKNLDKAQSFHENLKDTHHPETFQFYSKGIDTADYVQIKSSRQLLTGSLAKDAAINKKKLIVEVRDEYGTVLSPSQYFFTSALARKKGIVYSLTPPEGSGDGTVPDSSGKALNPQPTGYTQGRDGTVGINDGDENWLKRQHDKIFDSKAAQKITLRAVANLCRTKIKKETAI